MGVENRVEVYPFANADREQGPFPDRFGPHMGGPRFVGGAGRIGKIDHRFPGLGLG